MTKQNTSIRDIEAVVTIDPVTGLVVEASSGAIELLEEAAGGVIGAHCADLFGPAVQAVLSDRNEECGSKVVFPLPVAIRQKSGAARFLSLDLPKAPFEGAATESEGAASDGALKRLRLAPLHRADDADEVRRLDWALEAFSRATTALLRSKTLEGVLKSACEAIVLQDAYRVAAVALAEPAPSKKLVICAGAGRGLEYLDGLALSWDEDDPSGRGPTGRALRAGRPFTVRDASTDPSFAPWRERGRRFGIHSAATVPFSHGPDVRGVLIVYGAHAETFGPREMDLFQRLSEQLAFAIGLEADRRRLAVSEHDRMAAEAAELAARRKLEESEARYRLLADHANDIILQLNRNLHIEYVSPAVHQLGYKADDLIGRSAKDFLDFDHPSDADTDPTDDFAEEESRRGQVTLFRVLRADGAIRWLESSSTILRDGRGEISGMVAILRDVTERLAIERELALRQAEAEAATLAKTQFLANMSHEIRTPLTVVLGFTGLMENIEDLPEKARTYLARIKTGGNALLAIVNDVLDLSRLETGKIQLDPVVVELETFIGETAELIRANASAKGCAIRIDLAPDLPASVSADRDRLRQVLLNLLSNAIKFGGPGVVGLHVAPVAGGSGRLRFEVSDQGVGIAPDDQRALFQRFSQLDASNTRKNGGAGLGLAICKGIVEMMGGAIGVESVPGAGSTFWFTIEAPPVARPDGKGAFPDEAHALPALRVLVADDVEANREIVAAILEPFGVSVQEARNGAEAVDAATQSAYDLILMDMQMPVMDGLQACRAIRSGDGPNCATPILALSANVLASQVETCRQAGMNDHIGKPINPTELLHKIARWTEGEEACGVPEEARAQSCSDFSAERLRAQTA